MFGENVIRFESDDSVDDSDGVAVKVFDFDASLECVRRDTVSVTLRRDSESHKLCVRVVLDVWDNDAVIESDVLDDID